MIFVFEICNVFRDVKNLCIYIVYDVSFFHIFFSLSNDRDEGADVCSFGLFCSI